MSGTLEPEKAASPGAKKSVLTEAATIAGLGSALGGIVAVLLPELPVAAVLAAAVGALGGFFVQKIEHR